MSPKADRFRSILRRLRAVEVDQAADVQAEAVTGALLSLVARLRPDLTVDDALVEVDLTVAEYVDALDGQAPAPRPDRRRHLYALVTTAAATAGLAADRVAHLLAGAAGVIPGPIS